MKNNIVLIVDDVEANRGILAELFSDDYTIIEAEDGLRAMEQIAGHSGDIAVVLLDIVMPKKDGFDVLDFMQFNRYLSDIPVIMISASSIETESAEMECLKRGASDFIVKPFNANVVRQRVRNVIELFRYKRSLEEIISEQTEKFRGITEFVIDVLMSVMQAKNRNTRVASQRMRAYTREILNFIYEFSDEKYRLTPQRINLISASSILHDIGQLVIPERILNKTSPLTAEEQRILESHTVEGCRIIESMHAMENEEYMEMALEICRCHHERWDGSGYPERMVGDEIPISAQVVGIADTYDSLRSGLMTGRQYTREEAIDAIDRGDFGQFSPILIESCKMMQDKLNEIFEPHTV